MSSRRVVVTGVGTINPLGSSVSESWDSLISGKSGISAINKHPSFFEGIKTRVAGQVKHRVDGGNFDPLDHLEFKETKRMGRFCIYGFVAAKQAVEDSGILDHPKILDNVGVLMSSGIGGIIETEDAVAKNTADGTRVGAMLLPSILGNMTSGYVSIKYGFRGPNYAVVSACATGNHSIGDATMLIKCGMSDIMVAGSSESAMCKTGIGAFDSMMALSNSFNDTPEKASRPWDKDRDGFVMGEGAGALILEEYEHAKQRGAKIYCEIIGYGLSGDAYHITAPDPEGKGACKSMQIAIKSAKIQPSDINYINAHGTSTPIGDVAEILAYKKIFGDLLPNIPISSTKSATGHLLGGAGSVEAIFCIKAIQEGIAPPTINLDNPDEECAGLNLVPHKMQKHNISIALSNSFGFGGTNSSLLFAKI